MCDICDFYKKLSPVVKSEPAIEGAMRMRSIHGYYDKGDAAVLAQHYPMVGREAIEKIARLINHPRLLEVAGLVELVERYLEQSFSVLRGVAVKVVSNPLSILFWSPRDKTVHRVKTHETELLHGAMEKMALRRGSLDVINQFLGERYGLVITYGCSCCAIAVGRDDLATLYASEYYQRRETLGRAFDSDVLTGEGLFGGVSVADVPPRILEATADFGPTEVRSYTRYAAACAAVIQANQVIPDLTRARREAEIFLTGSTAN